jgi:DNA-nicking Smr family endonuclease
MAELNDESFINHDLPEGFTFTQETKILMPKLDLHGLTANQASVEVYDYILTMHAAGDPCCRIVHGKGTGVLQQVVANEIDDLTGQGIIESSFPSRQYPGAAIVVIFPV